MRKLKFRELSNRPRSCNKWMVWPNFLGNKGPCPLSPCPALGCLPCRHAGTYAWGHHPTRYKLTHLFYCLCIVGVWCFCYPEYGAKWFYNILVLLKFGPYKSTESNKVCCWPMSTSEGHTGLLWRGVRSRCMRVQSLSHADSLWLCGL